MGQVEALLEYGSRMASERAGPGFICGEREDRFGERGTIAFSYGGARACALQQTRDLTIVGAYE